MTVLTKEQFIRLALGRFNRLNVDHDTLVIDYQLGRWTLDAVLFGADGSATVIVSVDGDAGFPKVLAGIGRCSLYASLLGQLGCVDMRIRRALIWTKVATTTDLDLDMVLNTECLRAGVMPIYAASAEDLLAERRDRKGEETHGTP